MPSFDHLIKFLQVRQHALEAIGVSPARTQSISTTNQSGKRIHSLKSHVTTPQGKGCPSCHGQHYLGRCPEFLQLGIDKRIELVKSSKSCLNCLGRNHSASNCNSESRCRNCNQAHHSLLHISSSSNKVASHASTITLNAEAAPQLAISHTDQSSPPSIPVSVLTSTHLESRPRAILLATAQVTLLQLVIRFQSEPFWIKDQKQVLFPNLQHSSYV